MEKQWDSHIINPLFFEPFISKKFTFICQINTAVENIENV